MEEPGKSDLEAEIPDESKFAAVVFHNIQEVYIPGKDIRCCYSIKLSVSPTANDWIGLYKVGWLSYKDYLCYEYSPIIERADDNKSLQNSVLFRGSKLPREDAEFYQFCYVTSSGEIRGASYPFQIQFSKPAELECKEEEDDNGETFLVVRNRTMMLEDSLAKALDENSALKASKENMDSTCRSLEDNIYQLETQKNEAHTELQQLIKATDEIRSEKAAIEQSLSTSTEKIVSLQQALAGARSESLQLQKSLEVETLRCAQTDEDQKKLAEERVQMLQEVSDRRKEVERLQDIANEGNSQIKVLEAKIEQTRQEKEAFVGEREKMLREIKAAQALSDEMKQEHSAMERSLADQLEQMSLLKKENCQLKQDLDATNEELEQLFATLSVEREQAQQSRLDAEEMKCLGLQLEKLHKKVQDSETALSAAEETIEKILCESDEEKAKQQAAVEEYENTIASIQEQLDQERAFNNSLSSASDRQVAELQELLNSQLDKVSTACQQNEQKSQEIRNLKEEVKAKGMVISTMKESIEVGKQNLELAKSQEHEYLQQLSSAQKSEKANNMDGPYYALQTAHLQLKKQYLQVKKDMEDLWRQKSDLKRQLTTLQTELPDTDLRLQMGNLKKQIEDLRIRLNMGAEAYKGKFKECRKYQSQLKKLQRNTSQSPAEPASVSELEISRLKRSLEDEKTAAAAIQKSLENYRKEACETKEELQQVTKDKEVLARKYCDMEKELALFLEEKEKQLAEDKELSKHIECLHHELQLRTEQMKATEENFQKMAQEKEDAIAALVGENKNIQAVFESDMTEEARNNLVTENEVLRDEVLKQKKIVEDLYTKLDLIKHNAQSPVQLSPSVSGIADNSQQSRGMIPPPSQKVCPVCSIYYPPNFSLANFECHVQSHFTD